jgi:hypothetical protein
MGSLCPNIVHAGVMKCLRDINAEWLHASQRGGNFASMLTA